MVSTGTTEHLDFITHLDQQDFTMEAAAFSKIEEIKHDQFSQLKLQLGTRRIHKKRPPLKVWFVVLSDPYMFIPPTAFRPELKWLCHGQKCLHLFSDSEAYHEQMGPIPSSNVSLGIALSNPPMKSPL